MDAEQPQEYAPTPDAVHLPPSNPPDGKPHRKYYQRKNTFQPGNKAYRGGSSKRVKKSPLYRDYEYVFNNQSGPFRTDARKFLKKQLDENPDKFITIYKDLEKAHLAKTEKVPDPLSAGGKDAPSYDEGTQRCLELFERLLKTRGWEKNSIEKSMDSKSIDQSKPSGAG